MELAPRIIIITIRMWATALKFLAKAAYRFVLSATFLWKSQGLPIWGGQRGENMLDGGAPYYDIYETKDGKFMSVGALEPKFFQDLLKGVHLCHLYPDGERIWGLYLNVHVFKMCFVKMCFVPEPCDR